MALPTVIESILTACKERCDERCKRESERISKCENRLDDESTHLSGLKDDVNSKLSDLKIDTTISKVKWGILIALATFIGSILSIVIAATLMYHFGIASIQVDAEDVKGKTETVKIAPQSYYAPPSNPGWAWGDSATEYVPENHKLVINLKDVK